MSVLLADVLTIHEAEERGLKFEPLPFDLPGFCADLLAAWQRYLGNPDRTVRFNIYPAPEETPGQDYNCAMDGNLLRQILLNLLSNALKFSPPESEVLLELEMKATEVVFQVVDRGVGIPESEQAEIFSTFYRGSKVETKPGTGVGLAVVQKAVETHRGEISFFSREGEGTIFTVRLPRFAD